MLDSILNTIDKISIWTAKVARFLPYGIIVFMGFEVVARYAFNRPTQWSSELSQMLFGTYFMLAGAFTLLVGKHVNLDLLYKKLPPRRQAIMDTITFPLFFLFAGILVWQGWLLWWNSLSTGRHSATVWGPPLFYYHAMIPLGGALIILQGTAKLIRDIRKAITGR